MDPNHSELRSQNLMFTECRENKFVRGWFFSFFVTFKEGVRKKSKIGNMYSCDFRVSNVVL